MSLSKVEKRIKDLSKRLDYGNLKKVPVLLTDSRGRNLEDVTDSSQYPENKIYYWYSPGDGVQEQFSWLKENLEKKFNELGTQHLTLYVWLGTCDLTEKCGRYIQLRSEKNETVSHICKVYGDIHKYVRSFPTINIVFLELPFYSIYLWNVHRRHPNPHIFRDQDRKLHKQITEVNRFVNQINTLYHQNSPSFSHDLEKNRKRAGQRAKCGLYIDGVHPHPRLAKLWLLRIALRLPKDCGRL